MELKILNILEIFTRINTSDLNLAEVRICLDIIDNLSRNDWKPVNLPISHFTKKMHKCTFFEARKKLIEDDWIFFEEGTNKINFLGACSSTYFFGKQFFTTENDSAPNGYRRYGIARDDKWRFVSDDKVLRRIGNLLIEGIRPARRNKSLNNEN